MHILFFLNFDCAGSLLEHPGFSSWDTWAYLPLGMWDLSSLIRDRTYIGRWILNHWTIKEVPQYIFETGASQVGVVYLVAMRGIK